MSALSWAYQRYRKQRRVCGARMETLVCDVVCAWYSPLRNDLLDTQPCLSPVSGFLEYEKLCA